MITAIAWKDRPFLRYGGTWATIGLPRADKSTPWEDAMQAGTAGGIREAANDAEFGLLLEQASILVVDDEPGMRNFLMRTLGPRCKHLEVAADAGEAARKLDAQHFDVVIVEEAKTEFDLLDQQIYRISQLVTKLLQFARPEEYAGFVERHAPGDVIADCLPLVRHVLNKAEIEIVREDAATRLVLMNRTELQQVLVNLIVNAVYAMPDGGRLSLRTRDADFDDQQGVVIEVADTGVGMSKDVVDKVFDPFFTTKRHEGTGLGLSISQTLITRQGGSISVESEPGKGTTFTIWLPEAA
jgi:signal transduction histidine kinase